MEGGWRIPLSVGDNDGGVGGGGDSGGHNGNLTNNAWEFWDISTSHVTPNIGTRYDWSNPPVTASGGLPETSVVHALLFGVTNTSTDTSTVTGVGWNSDPHMMCLKLGKRHYYCEDVVVPDRHVTAESSSASSITKRGKPSYPYDAITTTSWQGARVTSSTRCQVDGCNVALGNIKEYYRRHKVCEIHSKAPKVVVSGLQQRFCQQCSRFHDVTEFDEAKRSCRRRLEGHNLRRRKGTLSNSLPRNFTHSHEGNSTMDRLLGQLSTLPSPSSSQLKPACALSLLSSPKADPWISSADLSSRCSAALYELIAANRATSSSGHFLNQNSSRQPIIDNTMRGSHDTDRFSQSATIALDIKHDPALDFGLLAMKEESKDPEEWTDYCWSAFGGANVV